jgi:hypothetical protein
MEHGQCTLCGERGHTAGGCPDLVSPLKEGFQGGGGGGHSHDDDCEDCLEYDDYLGLCVKENS